MARTASTALWLKVGNRFSLHDTDTAKVYQVTRTIQISTERIMVYISGCAKTKYFTMLTSKQVFKVQNNEIH